MSRSYRALLWLYPKEFRRRYADDLVQLFGDLAQRDGKALAWARTLVDLWCTAPQYRLETLMNAQHSRFALQALIAFFTLAGAVSWLTGVLPGITFLAIAFVLAVTQRSKLARSVRVPDPDRRRRLLATSAVLAAACIVGTAAMFAELGNDEHWHGGKLVAYNLYFFATAIGATWCFVAGLRTPGRTGIYG